MHSFIEYNTHVMVVEMEKAWGFV